MPCTPPLQAVQNDHYRKATNVAIFNPEGDAKEKSSYTVNEFCARYHKAARPITSSNERGTGRSNCAPVCVHCGSRSAPLKSGKTAMRTGRKMTTFRATRTPRNDAVISPKRKGPHVCGPMRQSLGGVSCASACLVTVISGVSAGCAAARRRNTKPPILRATSSSSLKFESASGHGLTSA